jgi:hypothetical protein
MTDHQQAITVVTETVVGAIFLVVGVLLRGSTIADTIGYVLAIFGGGAIAHAIAVGGGFIKPPDGPDDRKGGRRGRR